MNRIEELKIKNFWRVNIKKFALSVGGGIGYALESVDKLNVRDGADWLRRILANKKLVEPVFSTRWDFVKLEILTEIKKEKYFQEGSIVSFSNYQKQKSDDGTTCLVSDLPIVNNIKNTFNNELYEVVECALPFFAFSNPDASSGIVVTCCAALPTKENGMYDGVEYEIYKW